jgi:hypothetical protein
VCIQDISDALGATGKWKDKASLPVSSPLLKHNPYNLKEIGI